MTHCAGSVFPRVPTKQRTPRQNVIVTVEGQSGEVASVHLRHERAQSAQHVSEDFKRMMGNLFGLDIDDDELEDKVKVIKDIITHWMDQI